jgi:ABC-type iron transport system FetAB ATPase subunit
MLNKLSVTYNKTSISLKNITTLAILGDNGVGKTAFLERIALTNEDNIPTILNTKGTINYENFSVSIDDEEVQCENVKINRIRDFNLGKVNGVLIPSLVEMGQYICKGSTKYKVMIIYPYTFRTPVHTPNYGVFIKPNDEFMKFNNMIKGLIEELIDGIVIGTVDDFFYENGDNIMYLDSLGRGISNMVKLIWLVYNYKPDILLIDDIETLSLHPKRLQMLLKWFTEYIRDSKLKAMLFSTNSDAYVDLAEVDKGAKFLLLKKDSHIVMDTEEVLDRLDYEDLRFTAIKDWSP